MFLPLMPHGHCHGNSDYEYSPSDTLRAGAYILKIVSQSALVYVQLPCLPCIHFETPLIICINAPDMAADTAAAHHDPMKRKRVGDWLHSATTGQSGD